MKHLAKSALLLGAIGSVAVGSVTPSVASSDRWVAGAAGLAVGVAVGAAAANAAAYDSAYYNSAYAYAPGHHSYAYAPAYSPGQAFVQTVQYRDPAFAYTGDPNYRGYQSYGYVPGYDAYAYAPGYRAQRRGVYNEETRSVPRHYDPRAGFNSNTLAPWQDWKMQGNDY